MQILFFVRNIESQNKICCEVLQVSQINYYPNMWEAEENYLIEDKLCRTITLWWQKLCAKYSKFSKLVLYIEKMDYHQVIGPYNQNVPLLIFRCFEKHVPPFINPYDNFCQHFFIFLFSKFSNTLTEFSYIF